MKRTLRQCAGVLGAFACAMAVGQACAAVFNWTTAWEPVFVSNGTQYYYDVENDVNPDHVDLVGDASTTPAVYWDNYDNHLQFRLRMSGTSSNPQSVWQVFFNTDGSPNTLEYVLELDLSGDNRVSFAKVTGGPTLRDVSVTDILWTGTTANYASVFGTGSFIDFAIPYATFAAITGTTTVRLLASTSASHSVINKDYPLGLPSSSSISAVLSDSMVVPEPKSGLATGGLLAMWGMARILGRSWRRLAPGANQMCRIPNKRGAGPPFSV